MCERKFISIKYMCPYSYSKFGTFFKRHPVYTYLNLFRLIFVYKSV